MTKFRVLVVDDMSTEWEAAQKKLGHACDLVWKQNGQEALDYLLMGQDPCFDVIILDYSMGPGNGEWLCERLVKHGFTIPVLVNTNHDLGRREMMGALSEAGILCGGTRLIGWMAEPLRDVRYIIGRKNRLTVGASVRTLEPSSEEAGWAPGVRERCRWGVVGEVVEVSDSHGLMYKVRHEAGGEGYYDHDEVEPYESG